MASSLNLKKIGFLLGLFFFFGILFFVEINGYPPSVKNMIAVIVLMLVWWISEALPLSITALLPLVLFPLLKIESTKKISGAYINSTIFLLLGGFMIAIAVQRWNLHKRIALQILKTIGSKSERIVLGFMISCWFLSMWISNTATAVMMIPIGLSIILKIEEEFGASKTKKIATCIMIAIAYACSIGGITTLVGTPPNLVFARDFEIAFPKAESISFGQWFSMALPISLTLLIATWLVLTKIFFRSDIKINPEIVQKKYRELGKMSFEEKIVLAVFVTTALLWIFRKNLNFGFITIPGWENLFGNSKMINDSTVAIFMSILLFILPTKSKEQTTILTADVVKKIPWDVILLFGGGFALAKGFRLSKLSDFVASQFMGLEQYSIVLIILFIVIIFVFVTEVTSNTVSAEITLPILASVAVAVNINPLLMMIPATLSVSCAFMMPTATAPNAIVFGSGRVKIYQMAMVGFAINILSILIVSFLFYFLGTKILGIDINQFPKWAKG